MAANDYPPGTPPCFKAYDIRGKTPDEINPALAYRLGAACAKVFQATSAIIGHDARLSGPELSNALANGLSDVGVKVFDAGLCGTEEIYFATSRHAFDLGIMITASHNPANENGFKFVTAGAVPVSSANGLAALAQACPCIAVPPAFTATVQNASFREEYLNWLLAYTGIGKTGKPLRALVNAGNGCAGLPLAQLEERLPLEIIRKNYEPDGSFPNGVPNPLLPEARADTANAVIAHKADIGVAFDGDFDRCFFFDQHGNFIESYYLLGLLASELLSKRPGQKIIHDARLYWNTIELIRNAGGVPILSKAGHTFMKQSMRKENGLYGAEGSGHHYYRDFAYCDSGLLTMLLMFSLLRRPHTPPLADLIKERMEAYPVSGEINFRVTCTQAALNRVVNFYRHQYQKLDQTDGINMEFARWRFNLRASNTEPLLRLNLESKGSREIVEEKTAEISALIAE